MELELAAGKRRNWQWQQDRQEDAYTTNESNTEKRSGSKRYSEIDEEGYNSGVRREMSRENNGQINASATSRRDE